MPPPGTTKNSKNKGSSFTFGSNKGNSIRPPLLEVEEDNNDSSSRIDMLSPFN